MIDEIVVTARKREESLQDVPLSVTALTANNLRELNVQSPDDVSRFTPGFSYVSSRGRSNLERPVVRGQSSLLGTANASFFVDGVYINGPAISTELANLERVEVIKGPQVALYGRGTYAGAINYITRQPTDTFEGTLNLTAAEQGEYEVAGSVSGPLIDGTLSYFVAARHWEYGGEYRNQNAMSPGEKLGAQQTRGGTVKLLWTPVENFDATLLLSYAEDDDNHFAQGFQGREHNNCFPVGSQYPRSRGYYCGEVLGAKDVEINIMTALFPNGGGLEREKLRSALTMNWELGGYTLTSVSSYSEEDELNEVDASYGGYDPFAGSTPPNPGANWRIQGEARDDLSQELRLRSPGDGAFRWLAGAYYFRGSDDRVREDKVLPTGQVVRNPQNVLSTTDIENTAVFGSAEYDFTDQWTGTLELRVADDKITTDYLDAAGTRLSNTWSSTKPRATLRYEPDSDLMFYASFAQGNKPGLFNEARAVTVGASQAVDEEESDNYEIGGKMRLFNGRMTLNTAVYQTDISGQQLTQTMFAVTPTGFTTVPYIENIGKSRIRGVELESLVLLTDNWNLRAGYSYTDAKVRSYYNQDEADLRSPNRSRSLQDLLDYGSVAGHTLPRVPAHQGFLASRLGFPMSNGWETFVGGSLTYESSKYDQIHNLAETGDRLNLDLRAGIDGGRWDITLWGKNLTDDDTATDILRFIDTRGLSGASFATYRAFVLSLPRGRQFGANATFKF